MSQTTNLTLRDQIIDVLDQYPETRNSDRQLQAILWVTYYGSLLKRVERSNGTAEYYAPVLLERDIGNSYSFEKMTCEVSGRFMELPLGETVKRHRAYIQNTLGQYLPTDQDVLSQRGMLEEEARDHFGNSKGISG